MSCGRLPNFLLILVAGLAGCARGCGCQPQPSQHSKADKTVIVPPTVSEPPPIPSLGKPNALGVRRFSALRGQEIAAVGASPDGTQLVAASGRALYIFDAGSTTARTVDVPGLLRFPTAVGISDRRAAVISELPTQEPGGRFFLFDTKNGKALSEDTFPSEVTLGAALDGRLVVALASPASIRIYDGEAGALQVTGEVSFVPAHWEGAAGGSWGALAGKSGVAVVDASSETLVLAEVPVGKGFSEIQIALPVGDSIFIIGKAPDGKAVGHVVSRKGDLLKKVDLAANVVTGATRTADGARVLVYLRAGLEGGRAISRVFDAQNWEPLGTIETGPLLPSARSVARGEEVLFPTCHEAIAINVSKLAFSVARRFPSPQAGPCIDGIVPFGDGYGARESSQLITWR